MKRRIAEVVSLALVWAIFWADFDVATLASGLAVCIVILVLVPPSTFGQLGRFHPWRTLMFIFSSLGRLIAANAGVAKQALTGGGRTIREAIIEVDIGDVSEEIATVIATSISLSPGTVAVGIRPEAIYVHVLDAADLDAVRERLHGQAKEVKHLFEEGGL